MADIEKVINAWERCNVCNTSVLSDEPGKQAYIDCEYTTGLYCRQDKLVYETLELLKGQPRIVLCKDCRMGEEDNDFYENPCVRCHNPANGVGHILHNPNWYCADGEAKE